MRSIALLLVSACAVNAASYVFDNSGRLSYAVYDGQDLAVRASVVVRGAGWSWSPGQGKTAELRTEREPGAGQWSGVIEAGGGRGRFRERAAEKDGVARVTVEIEAETALAVEGVYLAIDVPREAFAGGAARLDAAETRLPAIRPAERDFARAEAEAVAFAASNVKFQAAFDRRLQVALRDRWERNGRFYTAWVELHRGPLEPGAKVSAGMRFTVEGEGDHAPATLTLDAARRRYRLQGFGGNYCFNVDTPVTAYTLANLRQRWARVEMKLADWEPENDNASAAEIDWSYFEARDQPGSRLRHDFEVARRIQALGIPYVVSVWHLPEWLYTDPGMRGKYDLNRKVGDWEELLESIGSYLLYAKRKYGVEPDLFSFNEANIGVYVLLTPEEHREAIKRIGARLAGLGLKTKMLLADATGPRGTHEYALPAANDAEAMRYVGAVAFHSWGGGTAEQYKAWGDLAEWLGLPLLVAELGVDAQAHRGRAYDSFPYAIREVRMYQELLLYARPQGTMQWEFTSDYSTVRVDAKPDGTAALAPTARFWFVKHFTDLTPPDSDALETASSHPDVLFTAFTAKQALALHVANLGAGREVEIRGVPAGEYRVVRTSETDAYRELERVRPVGGVVKLRLPERALVTLFR